MRPNAITAKEPKTSTTSDIRAIWNSQPWFRSRKMVKFDMRLLSLALTLTNLKLLLLLLVSNLHDDSLCCCVDRVRLKLSAHFRRQLMLLEVAVLPGEVDVKSGLESVRQASGSELRTLVAESSGL